MKHDIKLAQAMRILFEESIYDYYLLAGMSKVVIKSLSVAGAVGYDKKTGQVKLFISELYLEHMSVEDLVMLLAHEAAHVHLRHIFRKSIFPKMTENRAQDYIINDNIPFLRDRYDILMKRGVEVREILKGISEAKSKPDITKEEFEKLSREELIVKAQNLSSIICLAPQIQHLPELKGKVIRAMDSYTLASILDKHEKKSGEKLDGENQDQHGCPGDDSGGDGAGQGPEDGLGTEIPQNVIDQMLKESSEKISMSKNGAGRIPSHVEMRLKELEKSNYKFSRHLSLFAQKVISQVKERSWTRQNRRYGAQTQGYNQKQTSRLVVWIDTSGSMFSDDLFKKISGHLKKLSETFYNIEVLLGDTKIEHQVEIRNGNFELGKIVFKGGGGTSPQFVYDYAKLKKSDGVILFTDGYVMGFDSFKIKTLVALVGSKTSEIPGHLNIKLI